MPFDCGARKHFEIRVPASIANLGPGFDTLAVAVQLYLRLTVRTIAGHGRLQFRFLDHELCGENYIERAFRFLAGQNPVLVSLLVRRGSQRHSHARGTWAAARPPPSPGCVCTKP